MAVLCTEITTYLTAFLEYDKKRPYPMNYDPIIKEGSYIFEFRDNQQMFWFGVSYGKWLALEEQLNKINK